MTVLFPFAPADEIDDALLARVRVAIGRFSRFGVTFTACGSFVGDVLYLAPEPEQQFRDLTAALAAAFPEFPPYRGDFADVVPHLTVAEHPAAPIEEIRAELAARLPISTTAQAVELWMEGADECWTSRATFPLTEP